MWVEDPNPGELDDGWYWYRPRIGHDPVLCRVYGTVFVTTPDFDKYHTVNLSVSVGNNFAGQWQSLLQPV